MSAIVVIALCLALLAVAAVVVVVRVHQQALGQVGHAVDQDGRLLVFVLEHLAHHGRDAYDDKTTAKNPQQQFHN